MFIASDAWGRTTKDANLTVAPPPADRVPRKRVGWIRAGLAVARRYRRRHGRFPNLLFPRRFTEKMQWRKLFELDPLYVTLCDKIAVREFVESRIGGSFLVPCLWTGDDPAALPLDLLEPPYVIKSSHGCGHVIIVEDRSALHQHRIRDLTRSWMDHCHGSETYEPGYIDVPHRLIVERLLLERDGTPPLEIKAYVFGGEVATFHVVAIDPQDRQRRRLHVTKDWQPLSWTLMDEPAMTVPVARPENLANLVDVAQRVGAGLDHVRVDMYLCQERVYVGEVSVYSQSGLSPFDPDDADFTLGARWQLRRPWLRALAAILSGPREIKTI